MSKKGKTYKNKKRQSGGGLIKKIAAEQGINTNMADQLNKIIDKLDEMTKRHSRFHAEVNSDDLDITYATPDGGMITKNVFDSESVNKAHQLMSKYSELLPDFNNLNTAQEDTNRMVKLINFLATEDGGESLMIKNTMTIELRLHNQAPIKLSFWNDGIKTLKNAWDFEIQYRQWELRANSARNNANAQPPATFVKWIKARSASNTPPKVVTKDQHKLPKKCKDRAINSTYLKKYCSNESVTDKSCDCVIGSPASKKAIAKEKKDPKSPAAKSPAAKSPAAKSPAAKSPAAKSPAAKSPAAKSPAAKSPAAKSPAAKLPGSPKSSTKKPKGSRKQWDDLWTKFMKHGVTPYSDDLLV